MVLSLAFSGCSKVTVQNPTNEFAKAARLTLLKDKRLSEVSGIAASVGNPGLFWAHNDSGGEPEVYLIDKSLNILLTCRLDGIVNRDWEDITIGPGPEEGKQYVYVGEIGDNDARYQYKMIYRFEEPVLGEQSEIKISSIDKIVFSLEDKRKDTETLLIDPASKALFVISKREEPVWLYELANPTEPSDTLVAKKLFSLPITQVVGGDVSPDRKSILLKNYEHIYFWSSKTAKPVKEILKSEFAEVPYELEPQGEALTWALDHSGFYTLSEKNIGKDTFLYFYGRKASGSSSSKGKAAAQD